MFLQSTKKKTAQMKYDEFVKASLAIFREVVKTYLKEVVDPQFKECRTVAALEDLRLSALPDSIRDQIIDHIDKQKNLNIVEKTYLCLDLLRAVTSQIGTTTGHMVMHYAKAIQIAPTIVRPDGSSY
jgi:hypothetical protein